MKTEQISGLAIKRLIEDKSHQASLLSKEEEDEYEKLDASLRLAIDRVFHTFTKVDESTYFQSDDWWPNHLRGVELAESLYSEDLLLKLQGLLSGRYAGFRIILHIYSDLSIGSPHKLSALVAATNIWITHENIGT